VFNIVADVAYLVGGRFERIVEHGCEGWHARRISGSRGPVEGRWSPDCGARRLHCARHPAAGTYAQL